MSELPPLKTVVAPADVQASLLRAWATQLGSQPLKESICILLAQWALETAEGTAMMCFNIGNVKQPTDSHDYCMFSTFEYVNGQRIDIHPPDPGCRFRAFHSLDEGVDDYLHGMWNHWVKAWTSVVSGDPTGFAQGLHDQGYYTAPVAEYVAGVNRYFKKYMTSLSWPALTLNTPVVPVTPLLPDITVEEPDPKENA